MPIMIVSRMGMRMGGTIQLDGAVTATLRCVGGLIGLVIAYIWVWQGAIANEFVRTRQKARGTPPGQSIKDDSSYE
jgi:hypothetical protein